MHKRVLIHFRPYDLSISDPLTASLNARQQFSYTKFVNEVDHEDGTFPATLPKSVSAPPGSRATEKSQGNKQKDEGLLIDFSDESQLCTDLKKPVINPVNLFDTLTSSDNCAHLDRPLIQDVNTPIDPFDTHFSLRSVYSIKPPPTVLNSVNSAVTTSTGTEKLSVKQGPTQTFSLPLPEKTVSSSLKPESETFESKRHQIEEKLGNNPPHQLLTNELNVGTYMTGSQMQVVPNHHKEEKPLYSTASKTTAQTKAFDWLNDAVSNLGVSKNKTYSNVTPLYDEVPDETTYTQIDEKLQKIQNFNSGSSQPLYDEVPDESETKDLPKASSTFPQRNSSTSNKIYAPASTASDYDWDSFDSDFDDEEYLEPVEVGATARLVQSDHLEKPPPLPPRDYLSNSLDSRRDALKKKGEKARIFPVLQDGKQMSSTHYFLIPPKGCDNSRTNTAAVRPFSVDGNQLDHQKRRPHTMSEYQNVSDVEYANNKQINKGQLENGDRMSWSGMTGLKPIGKINNLSGNSKSCNRTVPRSVPNSAKSVEQNLLSTSPRDKVLLVQNSVLGVTDEECHAALCQTSWDEKEAMKYLKTEQLFRLGLTSREDCERLLEALNWNLELASSVLLDEFRSSGRKSVESTV